MTLNNQTYGVYKYGSCRCVPPSLVVLEVEPDVVHLPSFQADGVVGDDASLVGRQLDAHFVVLRVHVRTRPVGVHWVVPQQRYGGILPAVRHGGLVAHHHVVFHRGLYVVHGENDVAAFGGFHEAYARPGVLAAVTVRFSDNHFAGLQMEAFRKSTASGVWDGKGTIRC